MTPEELALPDIARGDVALVSDLMGNPVRKVRHCQDWEYYVPMKPSSLPDHLRDSNTPNQDPGAEANHDQVARQSKPSKSRKRKTSEAQHDSDIEEIADPGPSKKASKRRRVVSPPPETDEDTAPKPSKKNKQREVPSRSPSQEPESDSDVTHNEKQTTGGTGSQVLVEMFAQIPDDVIEKMLRIRSGASGSRG